MRDETVTFPTAAGVSLAGRLRRPAGRARAWVLFAHCFTCGKDLRAARMISNALAAQGLGVLRFDFTGLGQSGGDFEDTTFLSNVSDLEAAAAWLGQEEEAPALLVGHSLGGTAALAAATRLPSVKAVATVGAPFSPAHASWILDPVRDTLEADGQADITLAGRRLRVGRDLLRDLEATTIEEEVRNLRRAVLVLHAPHDDIVGVDNARMLFETARHPKSFVSLDGADHLLSRASDAAYVGSVIAAWADRYLPNEAEEADHPESPRGAVDVVTGPGFRTEVHAHPHHLVVDEPVSVGGEDSGPSPYDLLLASLGACTSMTLRMYADRKKLDLREVSVRLTHSRVHRTDCEGCDDSPQRIDVIERHIHLDGDLSEAVRSRMLQIADRCPVHRTLHGPLEVRTILADPI